MNLEDLRERYLAAAAKIVESAQSRGDERLSLPLRAHELSVALNADEYAVALPAFEELAEYYTSAEHPEPWLVNSLSWASGKFAEHLRGQSKTAADATTSFSTLRSLPS